MAFSDPQNLRHTASSVVDDVNLVTVSRTGMGLDEGRWMSPDGKHQFLLSHQVGKRARRSARLNFSDVVPDPLLTGVNVPQSMSVYLVVDTPKAAFEVTTTQIIVVDHLLTWLSQDSYVNAVRWLQGEI